MGRRDSPRGGAVGEGASGRAGDLDVPFLLWMLAAVVAGGLVADLEPNLLEEGIVVHAAERMAAGEHLYRDVLVHTAPLPYELLALLFRCFGAELGVARDAVLAFQALGTGLCFAALRRAGLGARAHLGAAVVASAPLLLFPLFSTFFYTTLAFYLALAALYPASRAPEGSGWAALAGGLVACVALCKQSTGALLAVGFAPVLLLASAREARVGRLVGFAAGGLALLLATVALYAARGDLSSLWYAQVELPARLAAGEGFAVPFVNLWPPGRLAASIAPSWVMYVPSLYYLGHGSGAPPGSAMVLATQLLYALPFLALIASALRGLPLFPLPHPLLWLNGALLLAMTANLFPRSDSGHLVVALPPAVVQLLLLGGGSRVGGTRAGRALAIGAGAALLCAAVVSAASLRRWSEEPSFGPRVPLRPVSPVYRQPAVPRVITYLRHHATRGEEIFVARQEPLLYFATETRNPTPFAGVLPGLRELQEPVILSALERIRWVVMSDLDQPIYTRYADELPGVQAYLERHFEIPGDFPVDDASWIAVLRRGPDRGEGVLDLLHARARAWVRDERGRILEASAPVPERVATQRLRRPLPHALGALGGGLDFELELPERALFQSGVGFRWLLAPDHQYRLPEGTTFVVSLGRAGRFEPLAERRVDDGPRAGRRWSPLEVDLSAYAGERVVLRLEVRSDSPIEGERLAWWGSPRIARRTDPD